AFCSLAGIYLLLRAEFLGMVQIVVYAGAIMVLFLFVIMYLNLQHDVETGVQIAVRRGIGWLAGAALLLVGAALLRRGMAPGPAGAAGARGQPGCGGGRRCSAAACRSGPRTRPCPPWRTATWPPWAKCSTRATCSRSRSRPCCCSWPWSA